MMQIFNYIGFILGYLLWWPLLIVKNFGIAIIIFTLIIKIITFPFSIKQQKSMAANQKLQEKQKLLREKYGNDRNKLNQEMQKLYEKENTSPMSGCLTSILPMLVLLGVFYSVAYPLTNTLHLSGDSVNQALDFMNSIPGLQQSSNTFYRQIEFVNIFPAIQNSSFVQEIFSAAEIANISMFNQSFNLLGLDLLSTPSVAGGIYYSIPALCLLTSIGSQFLLTKIQGNQMQGCMKVMLFVLPLFSAWIALNVPSAVGFYWIVSTVLSFVQTLVLHKFYNAIKMGGKMEAQHVELLRLQEKNAQKLQ